MSKPLAQGPSLLSKGGKHGIPLCYFHPLLSMCLLSPCLSTLWGQEQGWKTWHFFVQMDNAKHFHKKTTPGFVSVYFVWFGALHIQLSSTLVSLLCFILLSIPCKKIIMAQICVFLLTKGVLPDNHYLQRRQRLRSVSAPRMSFGFNGREKTQSPGDNLKDWSWALSILKAHILPSASRAIFRGLEHVYSLSPFTLEMETWLGSVRASVHLALMRQWHVEHQMTSSLL